MILGHRYQLDLSVTVSSRGGGGSYVNERNEKTTKAKKKKGVLFSLFSRATICDEESFLIL